MEELGRCTGVLQEAQQANLLLNQGWALVPILLFMKFALLLKALPKHD